MDDFNKNLFDAIENNNEEYFENFNTHNLKFINFKLFEKEFNNQWYNYIKGLYYDIILINYEKSIYYYQLSNNKLSLFRMALFYYPKNNKYAIYYFELALNKGYEPKCIMLQIIGECYYWIHNYDNAIYYYELALNSGLNTIYYIFICYIKLKKYEKTIYWLKKYQIDIKYILHELNKFYELRKYIFKKYFKLIK